MIHVILWLFPFVDGVGLGVLAMLLHECGHLLAARVLRVHVKRIGIDWTKGIYVVREQGSAAQSLAIALAGPLMNICMIPIGSSARLFVVANLCYALANLLPFEGSDGLRAFSCWQHLRATRVKTDVGSSSGRG